MCMQHSLVSLGRAKHHRIWCSWHHRAGGCSTPCAPLPFAWGCPTGARLILGLKTYLACQSPLLSASSARQLSSYVLSVQVGIQLPSAGSTHAAQDHDATSTMLDCRQETVVLVLLTRAPLNMLDTRNFTRMKRDIQCTHQQKSCMRISTFTETYFWIFRNQ